MSALSSIANWLGVAAPQRGRSESRASIEDPTVPLTMAEALLGDVRTDAGLAVTHPGALKHSAVWSAVDQISGDVAKLGLRVMKTDADRAVIDTKHAAYRLVRRKPNSEQTAFVFWQFLMVCALLWRNAYAYIFRDNAARPLELVPLLPDRTVAIRKQGRLVYRTIMGIDQGQFDVRFLPAEDILHIRGFTLDGLTGVDLIPKARESISLGLAAKKFAAKFFGNGARVSGVLSTPGHMSETAGKNLEESFNKKHQGLDQAHKVILLEEGVKFLQTSVAPGEGQMIETERESIKDVARFFKMPPHKLGDDDRLAYNSVESENQSYLDVTLDPHLVGIESECWDKLLTEEEKQNETHEFVHDRSQLLRADSKTRASTNVIYLGCGVLTINDVCRREGFPPAGPDGDRRFLPANWRPLDAPSSPMPVAGDPPPDPAIGPAPGDDPPPTPDDSARNAVTAAAVAALWADAVERVVRRVAVHAERASRDAKRFLQFLDELQRAHGDVVGRMLGPTLIAAGTLDGQARDSAEVAEQLLKAIRATLLDASGRCLPEKLPAFTAAALNVFDFPLP